MSVLKNVSARSLALFSFLLAGIVALTSVTVDAHPHRRKKHRHYHHSAYDSGYSSSSAKEVEVQVTVHRLVALDRGDAFSSEDFFARVTIGGQTFKSTRLTQKDAVNPSWRFNAVVPNGRTDVKIEVFDKDLMADDPIDINRVNPKRDLDFVVNTRTCRLEGFSESYRCGQDVMRAGTERKKAEMVFMVMVNKKP